MCCKRLTLDSLVQDFFVVPKHVLCSNLSVFCRVFLNYIISSYIQVKPIWQMWTMSLLSQNQSYYLNTQLIWQLYHIYLRVLWCQGKFHMLIIGIIGKPSYWNTKQSKSATHFIKFTMIIFQHEAESLEEFTLLSSPTEYTCRWTRRSGA